MFSLEVDLTGMDGLRDVLDRVNTMIQTMLPEQLLVIQTAWLSAVQGQQLPGMAKAVVNEEYAASITDAKSLEYPFNGDAFAGRVVSTKPAVAWRVEEGYPAFDMKPGLLGGPNAKQGKTGPYNTIPFTQGSAGSAGVKAPPMPADVYSQARALPRGGRLTGMGDYGRRSKLPIVGLMANPYTWQASPYEGMQRGGRAGHTSYTTFRRVSAASDPSSWIHPGVAGIPVMAVVLQEVTPRVQAAFITAIRETLGTR